MDILQRMQEHEWSAGDMAIAEAAREAICAGRRKIAGRDIDIELLRSELIRLRARETDLVNTANRYLRRARDAEDLADLLQGRLSALSGLTLGKVA